MIFIRKKLKRIFTKVKKGIKELKTRFKTKLFQNKVQTFLIRVFPDKEIRYEDNLQMRKGVYAPEIDLTVGPFAIDDKKANEFSELADEYQVFLDLVKNRSINREEFDYHTNRNPRCFIGIEIENSTEKNPKHVEGSICNLHILSKVGILIAFNRKNTISKIYEYLRFAKEVKKTPDYLFKNVALISKANFEKIMREYPKT